MSQPRSAPLPVAARIFITIVSLLGLAAVGRSVVVFAAANTPIEWVLFAILTIASGMFSLKVPSIDTRISVSETFAFASVLLFGPHVGVITLALDGIRISFRWKMNAQQTVFNFANLGLSMWAAGNLFFAASGMSPLFMGPAPSAAVVVYLALMILTYFAMNTGLTAIVVGLAVVATALAVRRSALDPSA